MPTEEQRRVIVRELELAGWHLIRHGSKHDVYGCPCGRHTAPVPRHRMLSVGVVSNIRRAVADCAKGA